MASYGRSTRTDPRHPPLRRERKKKREGEEKEPSAGKAPKTASLSLNPKYTFENFVVGKANEFAHAACSAAAGHLGSKYNPLFIYGCVGLGKTHALYAIGHRVLQNNPNAKVSLLYLREVRQRLHKLRQPPEDQRVQEPFQERRRPPHRRHTVLGRQKAPRRSSSIPSTRSTRTTSKSSSPPPSSPRTSTASKRGSIAL